MNRINSDAVFHRITEALPVSYILEVPGIGLISLSKSDGCGNPVKLLRLSSQTNHVFIWYLQKFLVYDAPPFTFSWFFGWFVGLFLIFTFILTGRFFTISMPVQLSSGYVLIDLYPCVSDVSGFSISKLRSSWSSISPASL